jgi:hypothetical protein
MKLPWLLAALAFGMCGVMVATLILDKPDNAAGVVHPTYAPMRHGGAGVERHGGAPFVVGTIYGVLIIGMLVGLMALGARKAGRLSPRTIAAFSIGFLLHVGVFLTMMISYRAYMQGGARPQFLALPLPTAWMIYGLWAAPVFFIVLYATAFDRWTYTDADRARFAELLAARADRESAR